MELIDFVGESASYAGRGILHRITLRIAAGERIALVGESGAGKSTLLKMIYESCGRTAALVPQDLGLVQSLTVFHNVYMGRLHRRSSLHNLRNLLWPSRKDVATVREVLLRLRLEHKLFDPISELSGGQQQRTAVGRALYHPGRVVIADEPVSNVDEHQARDILEEICAEKETVLLAMHDRTLALRFASRIVGLKGGCIVMDEPTSGMTPGDLDDLYSTAE